MTTFGDRLREERKRLNMTQGAFGALGGLGTNTVLGYEKGQALPSGDFLHALMEKGVDIGYLFYGVRSAASLREPEQAILTLFNRLPGEQQAMAFAMLNMLRRSATGQTATGPALTALWQAGHLYEAYLDMSAAGRKVVDTAVRGVHESTPGR